MTDSRIMQGFPPSPEHQVTIENWRSAPFSSWAFRNIRQLLPTAPIYRGDRNASAHDDSEASYNESPRVQDSKKIV